MPILIRNSGGGSNTSDATATPNDIVLNMTAYVDGKKITGTVPVKSAVNVTLNENTITVPAGIYRTDVNQSFVPVYA